MSNQPNRPTTDDPDPSTPRRNSPAQRDPAEGGGVPDAGPGAEHARPRSGVQTAAENGAEEADAGRPPLTAPEATD